MRRGLLKLEVGIWQQYRHCYVFDPSHMLVVEGHNHVKTTPTEFDFRSVPLKFSCRDVWGERGANKSVIRPMALGDSQRDCPELSRRSDRFKSLAHISKRGGSITSFAICQHCQNRVVAYRISKSASEPLSALSHRSLTTLKAVEPSRVQRLPPDLFLPYNFRPGQIQTTNM